MIATGVFSSLFAAALRIILSVTKSGAETKLSAKLERRADILKYARVMPFQAHKRYSRLLPECRHDTMNQQLNCRLVVPDAFVLLFVHRP